MCIVLPARMAPADPPSREISERHAKILLEFADVCPGDIVSGDRSAGRGFCYKA